MMHNLKLTKSVINQPTYQNQKYSSLMGELGFPRSLPGPDLIEIWCSGSSRVRTREGYGSYIKKRFEIYIETGGETIYWWITVYSRTLIYRAKWLPPRLPVYRGSTLYIDLMNLSNLMDLWNCSSKTFRSLRLLSTKKGPPNFGRNSSW